MARRDSQVLDYLLSLADSEGCLSSSTYAIACELGLHRQTLSRILRRLARKGYVTLHDHACTPIRVTRTVTPTVTRTVTPTVAEAADEAMLHAVRGQGEASISWVVTCSLSFHPVYAPGQAQQRAALPQSVTAVLENVTDSASDVTLTVTDKRETKEKTEEVPPAPPQEEKKQKKDKNTPTPTRTCEETAKRTDEERLALRRQQFADSLQPFAERYGQEMIRQFADYWTEPNRSNTRMRFELQRTWNTSLRLARWARNDYAFNSSTFNPTSSNHHDNHHHDHSNNPCQRPTSADYIRQAQEHAIAQTEQFVREAESRRGGVPPHLPF